MYLRFSVNKKGSDDRLPWSCVPLPAIQSWPGHRGVRFDLMRYSIKQRINAFGGNSNDGDRKTGNGKSYAMEKTGKISPPVGARRCDEAGYAAADGETPRHAGRTDEMLLCRPVLANPLNLQGSNRGKVYGLAAKCQEITARSARGAGLVRLTPHASIRISSGVMRIFRQRPMPAVRPEHGSSKHGLTASVPGRSTRGGYPSAWL